MTSTRWTHDEAATRRAYRRRMWVRYVEATLVPFLVGAGAMAYALWVWLGGGA